MNGNDDGEGHRPRLSVKQSSSSAQRRAMNARRHEISSQIRRTRRSHVVQLKRRLVAVSGSALGDPSSDMSAEFDVQSSSSAAAAAQLNEVPVPQGKTVAGGIDDLSSPISTAIQVKLYDVAAAFLRAARSISNLQQAHMTLRTFQRILSKAPTPCVISALASFFETNTADNESESISRAFLLCQALANILISTNADVATQLEAAKVLTNLAAMDSLKESSSSNAVEEEFDYYDGQQMKNRTNWCDMIIDSQAYSALIQVLVSFVSSSSPPTDTLVIIGTTQAILDLCEQCCWALGNLAGDSQRARDTVKSRGGLSSILGTLRLAFQLAGFSSLHALALCRNAAWALSNLARGTLSSALPFLAINPPGLTAEFQVATAWLLTQQDLFYYLLCTEQFSSQTPTQKKNETLIYTLDNISWFDVCFEMSWVLAFLTAKEDDAVDFLCNYSHLETSILAAVAFRLSQVIHFISDSNSIRISIPLVRIVGNIATACNGRFVAALLTTNSIIVPSSNVSVGFSPLSHSLATLIDLGCSDKADFNMSTIAAEAAWAAGTLLCDTGHPLPHPSTAAASVLIPSLSQAVISGYSKLELKREATSAIRNAISVPPNIDTMSDIDLDTLQTDEVRDGVLANLGSSRAFIRALIDLLKSSDTDAIYSAILIVHALLHRLSHLHQIQSWLDEAYCKDALESICDRASMSPSCGQNYWLSDSSFRPGLEKCADLAAEIIDDYFDVSNTVLDTVEDDEEEFSESRSSGFGTVPMLPSITGRGRGLTMPAWMKQSQMRE